MMHRQALKRYGELSAGVDEAGRGPLAGPVVAAAVILDPARRIAGLDDSKRLSPARRASLAVEIRSRAFACAVAWADVAEIDALNILGATMLAMRRAVLALPVPPLRLLVDGNRLPEVRLAGRAIEGEPVIRGDQTVPSISAASILAKTTRDAIMNALDAVYPGYDFARHKGYGTVAHLDCLRSFGPCALHRRSFAPVRAAG
jgi:ribonuclease HII